MRAETPGMRRRLLLPIAGLAVLCTGPYAGPAGADEPAPTFSAATTGLPVPLAHGQWEQDGPNQATLRAVAASAPSATTTFKGGWTSPLFVPPKDAAAFGYEYAINHGRVTTGNNVLVFEHRWRPEKGRWNRWLATSVDLEHEAARTEGRGGGGFAAIHGRRSRVQFEWRVTGKVVGADALQFEFALTAPA